MANRLTPAFVELDRLPQHMRDEIGWLAKMTLCPEPHCPLPILKQGRCNLHAKLIRYNRQPNLQNCLHASCIKVVNPNKFHLPYQCRAGGSIGWATSADYPAAITKPASAVRYELQSSAEHSPQHSDTVSGFARSLMSQVITLIVGEAGTEFYAHEDILCRLPFFRAALNSGFKETAEKKITMPEDEPEIIAALVEFLFVKTYTYTYNPGQESAKGKQTSPCDLREGSFHLRLYATAFKYDCEELAGAALTSLVHTLQQLDGIAVVKLLKESYDRGCDTAVWGAGQDMKAFKRKLPGIIKRVYVTDGEEMKGIVAECSDLANDLLQLAVDKN